MFWGRWLLSNARSSGACSDSGGIYRLTIVSDPSPLWTVHATMKQFLKVGSLISFTHTDE